MGIKRVFVYSDPNLRAREPTPEESKEIKRGLDSAPYCYKLIHQVAIFPPIFLSEKRNYSGSADIPRTISISLPIQNVSLDELVNRSEEFKSVWKTLREYLRSIPIHECAHKIDSIIFDYYDEIKLLRSVPLGKLQENRHPLYQALSELANLNYDGKKYEINDKRFGKYFTEKISEYFAELYATSRLLPELLTDSERRFFDKLHNGLILDGEKFLAYVSKNRRTLLEN